MLTGPDNRHDQRLTELQSWLSQFEDLAGRPLVPASSDASFRRYFRIEADGYSRIVMDAPPDREDSRPFVRIADYLARIGLNSPRVLAADMELGFVLMTDLGSSQYLQVLRAQPERADALYEDALSCLATLQDEGRRFHAELPPYDEALLLFELALFRDWLCGRHLQLTLSAADEQAWRDCCAFLTEAALGQPQVFVHRDFHSRNLMVTARNNPGVLDFQDAVRGPLTYDLVSLLKDCYIRLPDEKVQASATRFYDMIAGSVTADMDAVAFLHSFELMGVQRHLKAAGIFARLMHRDGKPAYLQDVPRTLGYVSDVARRYRELAFLSRLVDERCLPGLAGP
jgi:N-acetylmuramate 1-kinase